LMSTGKQSKTYFQSFATVLQTPPNDGKRMPMEFVNVREKNLLLPKSG
jgi:hypothetical protein